MNWRTDPGYERTIYCDYVVHGLYGKCRQCLVRQPPVRLPARLEQRAAEAVDAHARPRFGYAVRR